jgi:hypothetical protein
VKHLLLPLLAGLLLAGCATPTKTAEQRKVERAEAYAALNPEMRTLVDRGQIKVGMPMDAVYIAWGEPAEVLQSENERGAVTTWLYHGGFMQETRYWSYRQMGAGDGLYLERYLINDYQPRTYIRARLTFVDGKLKEWNTQPRPPE